VRCTYRLVFWPSVDGSVAVGPSWSGSVCRCEICVSSSDGYLTSLELIIEDSPARGPSAHPVVRLRACAMRGSSVPEPVDCLRPVVSAMTPFPFLAPTHLPASPGGRA
jgi:hypothetical protein